MTSLLPQALVAMLLDRADQFCYEVKFDGDPGREVVTFVGPHLERVTGCSPEQFESDSRGWLRLVHAQDRQRVIADTEAILASGREGRRRYRLRDREGRYRHIEDRIVPTLDAAGRAVGYQGLARDVTAALQVGDCHHRALQIVERAERGAAFRRLAIDMAHGFSDMLTVILGCTEEARIRAGHNEGVVAELRVIDRAVERGAQRLKTLLACGEQSRVERRVIVLASRITSLDAMLRQLVGKRIELRLFADASSWRVCIDPLQVDQVVMNLVANACQAMPDGGTLEITVTDVASPRALGDAHGRAAIGEYVCLRVHDTGTGMPPDVARDAFAPFFSTRPAGEAAGMGLASVRRILEHHRGHVCLDTEIGAGTTVSVYFRRYPWSHEDGLDAHAYHMESGTDA